MNRSMLIGLCASLMCGVAVAAEPSRASPSDTPQMLTETWLQLQASGKAASAIPQSVGPAERDLALQRWLDTYQHPIPEYYEQKKGGNISSGSGK